MSMFLAMILHTAHAGAESARMDLGGSETATLDWTELHLEISGSSHLRRGAWQDRRVQEQDALDNLRPRIVELAKAVHVTPGQTAAAWIDAGNGPGASLVHGLKDWVVHETRYHAKGGVEMDAVLDLHSWLRPALLTHAAEDSPPLLDEGPTGILIDARGTGFQPVFAPIVRTPAGTDVVAIGRLGRVAAQTMGPVLYVLDPADPRAMERVGDMPLFARGTHMDEGALVLDGASSGPMLAHSAADALVAAARVVMVIDPP